MTKRIQVGSFGNAHGVRGQVCLRSFTENPRDILNYTDLTDESGTRRFAIKFNGVKGNELIVTVEGITDRNAAELLKKTAVYAPETLLPPKEENTWYKSELIGLHGITPERVIYGKLIAIHNFGAGDIAEFELTDGRNEMLPFKKEFIGKVDAQAGTIEVFPPEYLESTES